MIFQNKEDNKILDLSKELNLQKRINLEYSIVNFGQIYTRVERDTKIHLYSDYEMYNTTPLAVFFKNDEVYKVMDAIASLFLSRWAKKYPEKNTRDPIKYTMLYEGERMIWVPESKEEILRSEAATPFINGYLTIDSGLKERLNDRMALVGNKDNGLPMQDLSAEMQKSIRNMLGVRRIVNPNEREIPEAEISKSRVIVKYERKPFGIHELYVTVNTEKGSYSSLYSNSRKVFESGAIKTETPTLYDTRRFRLPNKEYPKIKELNQIISLKRDNIYMINVVKHIHDSLGISCVTEIKDFIPQIANVNISAMPVWKFMDAVTKVYTDTEWEYRKSGVIVVRGPRNSGRGKSEKSYWDSISGK
jgi:hypothetical protein